MDKITCLDLESANTEALKETVKEIKNLCVGHSSRKKEYTELGTIPVLLKLIERGDAELTVRTVFLCFFSCPTLSSGKFVVPLESW